MRSPTIDRKRWATIRPRRVETWHYQSAVSQPPRKSAVEWEVRAMAEPGAKPVRNEAERAFRKAWKLLGRLEKQLNQAREAETRRAEQLARASGDKAVKRSAQLDEARAEIARIEGLLTELSELITVRGRSSAGQTVRDVANSVAAEIRDEAAEAPTLPPRRRNRHHRPRRRPAAEPAAEGLAEPAEPAAEASPEATPEASAAPDEPGAAVEPEPTDSGASPSEA
jgi:hypothetical protein